MSDRIAPMSMFDYDTRPVTPGVVLVGTRASRGAYAIRDFLTRNGYPFEWVDAERPDAVAAVLGAAGVEPSALPLCILPDGSRLASATVEQVAAGLGMIAAPSLPEYDLVIVGAGPAGLAAAVNAASEGLRTVVVEAVAPGGQAGTTSMIENLLGFPDGISGSELATRAVVQARRFGAELLLARPLADVSADGPGYVARLSDGTRVRGRSLLFASGVDWRRLDVPGFDDLLGAAWLPHDGKLIPKELALALAKGAQSRGAVPSEDRVRELPPRGERMFGFVGNCREYQPATDCSAAWRVAVKCGCYFLAD
jgi:thioredoxin reductase (NADPH)